MEWNLVLLLRATILLAHAVLFEHTRILSLRFVAAVGELVLQEHLMHQALASLFALGPSAQRMGDRVRRAPPPPLLVVLLVIVLFVVLLVVQLLLLQPL